MPKDKQNHLIAGLALALSAGLLLYPVLNLIPWRWVQLLLLLGPAGLGLLTASVAGAVKEIVWDWWMGRGTPEWLDFWATVAGGVVGLILIKFI